MRTLFKKQNSMHININVVLLWNATGEEIRRESSVWWPKYQRCIISSITLKCLVISFYFTSEPTFVVKKAIS